MSPVGSACRAARRFFNPRLWVTGPTGTRHSFARIGTEASPIAQRRRSNRVFICALAVTACRQRKRVRFTTAAELVNELMEARHQNESSRVLARWTRYELVVVDEMAYVAMPETAGELLFQVIAGRAERAAVIVTTNLPFSEWTTMFPNARLCKAMIDRLTDQAHIIETGTESYRFRRTLARQKRAKGE